MNQCIPFIKFDEHYILVNKETLLANCKTIAAMAEMIAQLTGKDVAYIVDTFGRKTINRVEGLSVQQIDKSIDLIMAQARGQSKTFIVDDPA